jgi:hypothetical protein
MFALPARLQLLDDRLAVRSNRCPATAACATCCGW